MKIEVSSANPESVRCDALLCALMENNAPEDQGKETRLYSRSVVKNILVLTNNKGEKGVITQVFSVPKIKASQIIITGIGNEKNLKTVFAAAFPRLKADQVRSLAILLPSWSTTDQSKIRNSLIALMQMAYDFNQCKSNNKNTISLNTIKLLTDRNKLNLTRHAVKEAQAISNAMYMARDLANLPGNICTPTYLSNQAKKLGNTHPKLKVSSLNEAQMRKLKMGALLSVSRGSRQPAKLIVINYQGGNKSQPNYVIVGKGLTFDAGGISIKPSARMDEMKYDMCGGASVIATLKAVAELELPINLIGLVPSSENLPDGQANKPGDIVTSMSGQTIEILNTDAEGRLILCDALTYAKRFRPKIVIDIATLTGACIVALGHDLSAMMANDDDLAKDLESVGEDADDPIWQLPLYEPYNKLLNSNFADLANIGGPAAGTITAGCFLSQFTTDYKWAHLDIAGTAWKTGDEKGATGRPVPLLVNYFIQQAKKR